MAMATTRFRVTVDGLSKGFLNALAFSVLAVPAAFALPGTHGSQNATPVPTSLQPIPTSIRNAPFSAEVSTEYDHELANGNHIHRETRGRVARDSQGRVRTETEILSPFRGGERTDNIAIQDPVQRVVIHLDAQARVARVYHLSETTSAADISSTVPGSAKPGLLSADPTTSNAAFTRSDARPNIQSLGLKLIQGVRAVGTRTMRNTTNPQGEPVTAVTEVWFSPELQMILLSISDDGESGRSIMRLTNLRSSTPNQELFRVPPEYTVRDSNPIATASRH
jgi:hypothetical protein